MKQRVKTARELDKLELQIRKATSETGWLEKAAKEMDIILDERYFLITTVFSLQSNHYL